MDRNIARQLLERRNDYQGARPLVDVEGMSSPRVCNFLSELVREMDAGECYLEIGTWKGLTLLSAAHDNPGRVCIGCDKFRLWGRFTGWGLLARRALGRNVARHRGHGAEVIVHATTAKRLFARAPFPGSIGVYFYDGDHGFEGTRHGITAAAPHLSPRSVLLVDDWNDPVIQRATRAGLAQARLRVLWSRELPGDHSTRGWWNGLGVFWVEQS